MPQKQMYSYIYPLVVSAAAITTQRMQHVQKFRYISCNRLHTYVGNSARVQGGPKK